MIGFVIATSQGQVFHLIMLASLAGFRYQHFVILALLSPNDENSLSIVLALKALNFPRITAASFKTWTQKVKSEEGVSRSVFLLPKALTAEVPPHVRPFVIDGTTATGQVDLSAYHIIDKAVPGGQPALGMGCLEHTIRMSFSVSAPSDSTPKLNVEMMSSTASGSGSEAQHLAPQAPQQEQSTPKVEAPIVQEAGRRLKPNLSLP
jgi:hypothetical protein